MPRALLVWCCAAVCSSSLAVPVAAAPDPPAYVPPVDAPVLDPFRPPASAVRSGQPGPRVRHHRGHAGAHGGRRARDVRRIRRRLAPRHRAARRRRPHVVLVPGPRRRRGRPAAPSGSRGRHHGRPAAPRRAPRRRLLRPRLAVRRRATAGAPGAVRRTTRRRAVRRAQCDQPADRRGGRPGRAPPAARWAPSRAGCATEAISCCARWTSTPAGSRSPPRCSTPPSRWRGVATGPLGRRPSVQWTGVHPPEPSVRRVAVLVAGLGSHSHASTVDQVDTAALGYEPPDVVRFSYEGGRVPDDTDAFSEIASAPYEADATQTDLRITGARLADLVESVAAAAPGVPVDLYAHSQGGVVARLALIELERRHGVEWLRRIGLLATLGTPARRRRPRHRRPRHLEHRRRRAALDAVGAATGAELDPGHHRWASSARPPTWWPSSPSTPCRRWCRPSRSRPGATSSSRCRGAWRPAWRRWCCRSRACLPTATCPAARAPTRELALALAGLPPGCQSFREALLDQGVGEGISLGEDLAGALGFLAAARADVRSP